MGDAFAELEGDAEIAEGLGMVLVRRELIVFGRSLVVEADAFPERVEAGDVVLANGVAGFGGLLVELRGPFRRADEAEFAVPVRGL